MSDTSAPPLLSSACEATYEKVEPRDRARTHTCDLPQGHDGRHHCPRCGEGWSRPRAAWSA